MVMKYRRGLIPLRLPLIFTLSNVSDHMEKSIIHIHTIQKKGKVTIVICQKQSINNEEELTIFEPSYSTICHYQSKSLCLCVKLFNTKSEEYLLCHS
jgi:hypothetical protein